LIQSIRKPIGASRRRPRELGDLGTALGLSAPAAAERVRKLQDGGIVRGFTRARPGGRGLSGAGVRRGDARAPGRRARLPRRRPAAPVIQECHHVAGDDDFLLKVRAREPVGARSRCCPTS
jgi:Lrp/AsnC family leucine-responsive transcriptional regulator